MTKEDKLIILKEGLKIMHVGPEDSTRRFICNAVGEALDYSDNEDIQKAADECA